MPRDDLEPSASQLLAFSPGKEQAAGVWETCLAPGWPQLRTPAESFRALQGICKWYWSPDTPLLGVGLWRPTPRLGPEDLRTSFAPRPRYSQAGNGAAAALQAHGSVHPGFLPPEFLVVGVNAICRLGSAASLTPPPACGPCTPAGR